MDSFLFLLHSLFRPNSSVNWAGKGESKAQWSQRNKRRGSLSLVAAEPRDACGSICGHIVTREKNISLKLAKLEALPNLVLVQLSRRDYPQSATLVRDRMLALLCAGAED